MSLGMRATNDFDVTVVEAEFQPGYHSSGRSAAVFHIPFENDVVHRLSLMSESFFADPPETFGGVAGTLGNMMIATFEERHRVEEFLDTWTGRCPWLKRVVRDEMISLVPVLSPEFQLGVLDEKSKWLDTHALLDGYRRQLLESGGRLETSFRIVEIDDSKGFWTVTSNQGQTIEADILVNAAGAWADEVAQLAHVDKIGLVPRRRTGLRVHPSIPIANWPMCYLASGGLYFKPEGETLMLSPADAMVSAANDAQPEIIDVAIALDRLNQVTGLDFDRPAESWAGLRSFVDDEAPVIGFAPDHPNFFWFAAFGGFGIQTSPACSQIGCGLLRNKPFLPPSCVDPEELSPIRLHSQNRD